MSNPTDSRGTPVTAGCTLYWVERDGTERAGTVVADPGYEGGLRVGGRSINALKDDAVRVTVIRA